MAELNTRIETTRVNGVRLDHLLRTPGFEADDLQRVLDDRSGPASLWNCVVADRRYASYLARQRAEVARTLEMEHRRLPEADYLSLTALRTEARESLARFRPRTYGQAARLEGITPADLTLLAVLLARVRRPGDFIAPRAAAAPPR